MKSIFRFFLFAAIAGLPTLSQAYVDCSVTPRDYYVGDDGLLWVEWTNGGAANVSQSDVDFKPILASVMAALLSGRSMTVRYADGTNCAANPAPFVGVYLR